MPDKTKTVVVFESHEQTIIRRTRRVTTSQVVTLAPVQAFQEKRKSLRRWWKTVVKSATVLAPLSRRLKTRVDAISATLTRHCNKPKKLKGEKIMTIKKTLSALVVATMLATLIAFTGTRSKVSAEGEGAPALEGSWEITVTPDGGAPIVDLATFSAGGGIVNSDPDPNLSAGHGSWVRTGGHEFAVTFVHFLSDQGAPLGTLKVRAVVQLDKDGEAFSGPFRTDVIIGGNVVQSICGTVQARRISVEPLEACP